LQENTFTNLVIGWYQHNKRTLPWRETKDPYRIWLSEIILQQTRVDQGLPYYLNFIKKFPGVIDLANATEVEVLRLWQGLGYYSRARNLLKTAKIVVEQYSEIFPKSMKSLLELPGIGRYTAAAIASLAYNEPVPVVDGNVYRLLARYFGIKLDTLSAKAFEHFYQLGINLIDKESPGDYNQAVMEFGALLCKPQKPDCEICLLKERCLAYENNWQSALPVKKKKRKPRNRFFNYLILTSNDKILMRQRSEKDIWRGLYEFVLIETAQTSSFLSLKHEVIDMIKDEIISVDASDNIIRHILTHQILNVSFALVELATKRECADWLAKEGYRWYDLAEIEELPKPVLISNYLDNYLNLINLQ